MGYRERDQVVTAIICTMAFAAAVSAAAMFIADLRTDYAAKRRSIEKPPRHHGTTFPGK